jgi:hypothetical protein
MGPFKGNILLHKADERSTEMRLLRNQLFVMIDGTKEGVDLVNVGRW